MEKRKIFAKNLKELREKAELSQAELAKRVGVTPPTVTGWEQGKYMPENLETVAAVLKVNAAWMVGESTDSTPSKALIPNAKFVGLEAEGLRKVPVISWARAGSATDYEDMQNYIEDWTVTQTRDENAFAIIVEGDSMEPVYQAGDLIVCSPNGFTLRSVTRRRR
jgi:transcriptional regulator with XRE-family HTH domain